MRALTSVGVVAVALACTAFFGCGSDEGTRSERDTEAEVFVPEVAFETDAAMEVAPIDSAQAEADADDTTPEATTCATDPGAFGCPCDTNDACNSGFCLASSEGGKVCTKYCTSDCPDGYDCSLIQFPGSDPTFLCIEVGLNLCRPCTTDAQCQAGTLGETGDRCVKGAARDGSFCGVACEDDDACPAGYRCDTVSALEGGAETSQCVPESGQCECTGRAIEEDAWTTCADHTCTGTRTCTAAGLTACDARPWSDEVCDGHDNDCDAAIDEGSSDLDDDGEADCVDADDDNDGVPDDVDNCPLLANVDQHDNDDDGLGDLCDPDDDGDGVADGDDNCPLIANANQADSDGDGGGDACDDGMPDAPLLDAIAPASPSSDPAPRVSGRAERGATIAFYDDECTGLPLGTTTVDAQGELEGPVAVALNATTTIYATATDGAGHVSPCSDPIVYTHDDVAPDAPTLLATTPTSPSRTNTTPVVSGTSELATIRLYVGVCAGSPLASVASTGVFQLPALAAPNALTTFVADAVDTAGNISACSAPLGYVHDDVAPAPPTLVSTSPGSPSNSSTTPALSGAAENDTTVALFTTATCTGPVSATVSAPNGAFTTNVQAVANGTTTFYGTATDRAGNTSGCSPGLAFTHNALVPNPPVITGSTPASPSRTSLTPLLAGTSAVGTITWYTNGSCTAPAATTTPSSGTFSATLAAQANATTAYSATVADIAGNTSACSAPYRYVHDDVAPAIPTLTHTDPASPSAAITNPLVNGSADAGTTIALYARADCAGSPATTGVASANGSFALTGSAAPNATTEFSATARDAAGNISGCSPALAYTHDAIAPAAPVLSGTTPTSPSTTVTSPVVNGSAEIDTTVNIFANANCSGAAIATTPSTGTFSANAAAAANATTTFSANATDAAGLTSACSNAITFIHDSVAPTAPVITATAPASPTSTTTTPNVSGTTDANTTVALFTTATCTGTPITAAASGTTFTITGVAIANATTTFYANARDAAGNTSGCSAGWPYTHDNVAPATPTLVNTTPLSPSNQTTTPFIDGIGPAGMRIALFTDPNCTAGPVATMDDIAGPFSIRVTATASYTTTFYAHAVDATGNASGCSNGMPFTHDTQVPAAPILTALTPSLSRASTTTTVTGTTEAGTVTFYASATCGGAALTTLLATASISSALTLPANATTPVSATVTDAAGNTSGCSNAVTFTHDAIAPNVPTIDASNPTTPSRTSATPTLSGSADDGSTVRLFTNASCSSAVAATDLADNTGFAAQVTAQANGTRTFYATATDVAGNASACSAGFAFTHDDGAPAAPTWTGTDPLSPSRTSTSPKLEGSAEAGTTVHIYLGTSCGGTPLITTTAAPAFTGSAAASANQPTSWTATATDAAGNTSTCSAAITFVHDSVAPAAPTLTSTTPTSPSNTTLSPVIHGKGEAGASIRLYTNPTCTDPQAGAATAHATSGDFDITATVPANSLTTFYAKAIDAAGNTGACSAGIDYLHDNLGSDAPIITATNPGSPNRTSTAPIVTGNAEAGATVRLYKDATCQGTSAGTGPATTGTFNIATTAAANATTYFYAQATDGAGNLSACSNGFAYTHDITKPNKPTLVSTSPVSPATSTTPTLYGSAEAATTVRLYTNNTCTTANGAPQVADGDGGFDISATVSATATTTFYATATDAAGNVSDCSNGLEYISDNTAPAAPVLTTTNPPSPSNSNTAPTVSGTSEVNATIRFYATNNCSGPVVATLGPIAQAGFAQSLVAGANATTRFSATASDVAGNLSGCSNALSYTHDDGKPPTPVLTGTNPPSPSKSNGTPSILGTSAETGVTIDLFDNGTCSGVAVTTLSSAPSPFAIATTVSANTPTTFSARSHDAANNLSGCSNPVGYTYDTQAPATPAITASNPLSPSRVSTTPTLSGSAESGATVDIFKAADCTGPIAGTGTAAGNAFTGIGVNVTANAQTTFYARATDAAGNASGCSPGFDYRHDNQGPLGLTLTGFSPGSPTTEVNTAVLGTIGEAGATVTLYKTNDCSGAVAATRTNAGTSFSINTSGNGNTTTYFTAKATDGAGNTTGCSNILTFIHDNLTPLKPVINDTDPDSPTNSSTTPKVKGTTSEANVTVNLFTNGSCSGTPIATGAATAQGGGGVFEISAPAGANTTTTFYAEAVDIALNRSACSNGFDFRHDDVVPGTPVLTGFSPGSPSTTNNNTSVQGTASDNTAKVYVYASNNCSGAAVNPTGASVFSNTFTADFTATTLGCTPVSARAVDAAGNQSGCSNAITFAHYGCAQCPCSGTDWVRQFGTSAADGASFAVVDGNNNVYVAGTTYGALPGQTARGDADAYLMKYASNGDLLWTRQIGTAAWDVGGAVAVDPAGNVYVAGGTEGDIAGTGTGPTLCPDQPNATTCGDSWISKYSTGGALQWTTRFATLRRDQAIELAWDGANGRLIALAGSANTAFGSGQSPQVLHANATTGVTAELWAYTDDTQNKSPTGLTVDAAGNVYVQGRSQWGWPGALSTNGTGGNGTIFLVKIAASGTQTWVTHWGSPGHDFGYDVVVDGAGNIFGTGFLQGAPDGAGAVGGPYRGANGLNFAGWGDAAVARFNSAGAQQWARIFGTPVDDYASSIALYDGRVYVSGMTRGNIVTGTNVSLYGGVDFFLASFNLDGTVPAANVRQQGTAGDDSAGRATLTATGTWFIPGASTVDWTGLSRDACTYQGANDAFLARFCAVAPSGPATE